MSLPPRTLSDQIRRWALVPEGTGVPTRIWIDPTAAGSEAASRKEARRISISFSNLRRHERVKSDRTMRAAGKGPLPLTPFEGVECRMEPNPRGGFNVVFASLNDRYAHSLFREVDEENNVLEREDTPDGIDFAPEPERLAKPEPLQRGYDNRIEDWPDLEPGGGAAGLVAGLSDTSAIALPADGPDAPDFDASVFEKQAEAAMAEHLATGKSFEACLAEQEDAQQ